MKPRCHNRPPRAAGAWMQVGPRRWRWFWAWSPDRCATHDGRGIGPNGQNYPAAHGWLLWCATCRWNPMEVAHVE